MERKMLDAKWLSLQSQLRHGAINGRSICRRRSTVVLTARHKDQLDEVVSGIRSKGGTAMGIVADVTSAEDH